MKKALLLSIAIVCMASMAFAQGGTIGLYSDPGGTNCELADVAPGLCSYYVVHTNVPGATAAQFAAPQPACMLAVYLSDTAVYPVTIGSSQGGVAIGYGACIGAPNNILIINYFCQALTGACCGYSVIPDPNVVSGNIEVVDCLSNLLVANGSTSFINGNATCTCTVATEESTWGQVKSLYAE